MAESIAGRLQLHMSSMPYDSATGRRPFTKADTLAREYIVDRFGAFGLEPASMERDWLQRIPVIRSVTLVPGSRIVVSSNGRSRTLQRKVDYVPRVQSGDGAFSGGLAFIGYGIRAPLAGYDDFAKVDLRGKTVVLFSSPPRHIDIGLRRMAWRLPYMEKVALIDSLGGRAVMFVSPASYDQTCNTLHDLDRPSLQRPDRLAKSAGIPFVTITHDELVRLMTEGGVDIPTIERELETASSSRATIVPEVEISMNIRLERTSADASNVLGFRRGRDTTTIVIGAHYDGPSYNDNASGVAAMLELARLSALAPSFDCNLLFAAFGLEEMGCVGSRRLLNEVPMGIGTIKAMINFDVIGRINSDTLLAGNAQPEAEWREIASGLDGRGLVVVPADVGASDYDVFRSAGIPSFWFFQGYEKKVHNPDALDSIDFGAMERAVLYALDFLRRIDSPHLKLEPPRPREKLIKERPAFSPDSLSGESKKSD